MVCNPQVTGLALLATNCFWSSEFPCSGMSLLLKVFSHCSRLCPCPRLHVLGLGGARVDGGGAAPLPIRRPWRTSSEGLTVGGRYRSHLTWQLSPNSMATTCHGEDSGSIPSLTTGMGSTDLLFLPDILLPVWFTLSSTSATGFLPETLHLPPALHP